MEEDREEKERARKKEKNKKVGGEGLRKREAGERESELLPENLCESC